MYCTYESPDSSMRTVQYIQEMHTADRYRLYAKKNRGRRVKQHVISIDAVKRTAEPSQVFVESFAYSRQAYLQCNESTTVFSTSSICIPSHQQARDKTSQLWNPEPHSRPLPQSDILPTAGEWSGRRLHPVGNRRTDRASVSRVLAAPEV